MNGYAFTFCGVQLMALPDGALHWPEAQLLCVSDLHLGRAERQARRGGALLPPYEGAQTLTRLDAALAATGARRVICLGDSFDDSQAAANLGAETDLWLTRMMAGRDWTWITGNHDPTPIGLGGAQRAALRVGPLVFRHIADPAESAEISGHYHPKATLAGRSRRCFLLDAARLILPAYGAYTGGLACHDPALARLMGADALAILTGGQALAMPMPRERIRPRSFGTPR